MKTRLFAIFVIVIAVITVILIFYYQDVMMLTGMIVTTDCKSNKIKHNDQCIKLEIPSHIGTLNYGIDSIVSYCEELRVPPNSGIGLERCMPFEFVDVDELLQRIQNNNTEPLTWPSTPYLLWCADTFDSTKHEFNQGLENYKCDTPICPESEPPLFSSALNDNDDFIEKGCANFVDKWAYLTEDNDFTWHYVNWESFVEHHYHSDPISDPQRNQKCAELFDLIIQSAPDSDLWYELTETNDFVDAQCASIVEEWEHMTRYNVWNIGISWDKVAADALR